MREPVQNRTALLLVCVGLGLLVGVIGMQVTGSEAWFLAVPGVMAIGWLFVANPAACQPDEQCAPPADHTDAST